MTIVMPFSAMFTDRLGRKFFLLAVEAFATIAMYWFFKAAAGFIHDYPEDLGLQAGDERRV
jgi:hypothetical protein